MPSPSSPPDAKPAATSPIQHPFPRPLAEYTRPPHDIELAPDVFARARRALVLHYPRYADDVAWRRLWADLLGRQPRELAGKQISAAQKRLVAKALARIVSEALRRAKTTPTDAQLAEGLREEDEGLARAAGLDAPDDDEDPLLAEAREALAEGPQATAGGDPHQRTMASLRKRGLELGIETLDHWEIFCRNWVARGLDELAIRGRKAQEEAHARVPVDALRQDAAAHAGGRVRP